MEGGHVWGNSGDMVGKPVPVEGERSRDMWIGTTIKLPQYGRLNHGVSWVLPV